MQALLRVNNLQVDFVGDAGTHTAVSNLSFEVQAGEVLAIVGESGSGKSVTALSVLRLLPPDKARYTRGSILFSEDGRNSKNLLTLSEESLRQVRGNRIAMIFQEPMTSLNPAHTCGYQVQEALQAHADLTEEEARTRTLELFEKVQLPDPVGLFHRYPHQLSGGQKQRIMIAMAMSCRPALLICDEPTTALDVTVQKSILQLLKALQAQENMSVIFITHDLSVVAEIADRVLVMHRGKIVEEGSAEQIFRKPEHPYTKGLLACRPALHRKGQRLPVVADFWSEETGVATGQLTPVFRSVAGSSPYASIPHKVLLRVEELYVWFPGRKGLLGKPRGYSKAVNGVSFKVYQGETLGLVGESGCGKSTLGRALLGLIEPSAGSIWFNGNEIRRGKKGVSRELRKEIQIVFQDPYSSLNPRMKVGQAIAEPMQVHGLEGSPARRKERVIELLEKVGLEADHAERYPHEFSGGQRQRIVIARALALRPSFLLCDESVSALDVSVQAQVLNLLNDLRNEFGFTTIFISHDLSVVRYMADRIIVMNRGRIEEMGNAERVYLHPKSDYTRQLILSIPREPAWKI